MDENKTLVKEIKDCQMKQTMFEHEVKTLKNENHERKLDTKNIRDQMSEVYNKLNNSLKTLEKYRGELDTMDAKIS